MDERQAAGAASVTSDLNALVGDSEIPGIQYLVVGPNGVTFEFNGGLADIRHGSHVDAGTTMMAYSMSKTITAVAALQLIEAGKLSLDSPVEHYVATFPYGSRVTVRHLIAHTSGIPNPIPLRWVHPAASQSGFDERVALSAVLADHPRLSFEPGSKYAYSNIGYWLLGSVIERASGQTFTSYVHEHIVRRLGLSPRDLGYVVADPAHHASGYLEKYSFMNLAKGFLIDRALVGDYSGSWLEIRSHYVNGAAFGGLVGTARGFATFLQDQLRADSVLLNSTTRRLLYTAEPTARGPIAMTLGWHIGDRSGTSFFYKEGGGGGFHCLMRLYPEDGIGTVVMTNATGSNVTALLNRIDPAFLR